MNRRQKKKAFKKRYGYNPGKAGQQVNIYMTARGILEGMKKVIEAVKEMCGTGIRAIREMPEDDFLKRIENPALTKEQKQLAWKIRMTDKGGKEE